MVSYYVTPNVFQKHLNLYILNNAETVELDGNYDNFEYQLGIEEYRNLESYGRDYYFEYFGDNNNERITVVLLGDTFLNSGNLLWTDSFSYKLYEGLNREVNVLNISIPYLSTSRSFEVIENFLDIIRNKNTILFYNVGIFDKFENYEGEQISGIHINEVKVQNMNIKLEELEKNKNSFFYKMPYSAYSIAKTFNLIPFKNIEVEIDACDRKIACLDSVIRNTGFTDKELEIIKYIAYKKLISSNANEIKNDEDTLSNLTTLLHHDSLVEDLDYVYMHFLQNLYNRNLEFNKFESIFKTDNELINRYLIAINENASEIKEGRALVLKKIVSTLNISPNNVRIMGYAGAPRDSLDLKLLAASEGIKFLGLEDINVETTLDGWMFYNRRGVGLIVKRMINEIKSIEE